MNGPEAQEEHPLVLLLDNYDSFVFNLARYVEELGCRPLVVRSDAVALDAIRELAPHAIIISPGPGTPKDAGVCEAVIRELGPHIPLLGVCLGHQAIATALGGALLRANLPQHGRASWIEHSGTDLFAECSNPLRVGRYHSLIVSGETLPEELLVTSQAADGSIMSLRHRNWPVWGVQFHPESVLTGQGHQLLWNFLHLAGIAVPTVGEIRPNLSRDAGPDDFYRRAISPDALRPL